MVLAFTLRQQITDKDREVLNQALTLATDKSADADRRVAGIWALNHYWSEPQYSNLVASTLTALWGSGRKKTIASDPLDVQQRK